MVADFFTKPLQGTKFRKTIMNLKDQLNFDHRSVLETTQKVKTLYLFRSNSSPRIKSHIASTNELTRTTDILFADTSLIRVAGRWFLLFSLWNAFQSHKIENQAN